MWFFFATGGCTAIPIGFAISLLSLQEAAKIMLKMRIIRCFFTLTIFELNLVHILIILPNNLFLNKMLCLET